MFASPFSRTRFFIQGHYENRKHQCIELSLICFCFALKHTEFFFNWLYHCLPYQDIFVIVQYFTNPVSAQAVAYCPVLYLLP